jgi:hypothetical protein
MFEQVCGIILHVLEIDKYDQYGPCESNGIGLALHEELYQKLDPPRYFSIDSIVTANADELAHVDVLAKDQAWSESVFAFAFALIVSSS